MAVMLLLGACGQASSSPARGPSAAGDVLYISTETGLRLVSSDSGDGIVDVPGGIASPDNSVLVATERDGAETVVRRMDADGKELTRWKVPGEVEARVVSPLGTSVALTEATGDSASDPYTPVPRERTRVVVATADGSVEEFDLPGNFEPEAFSTEDDELFLLEYLPALAPTKYRVRRLLLGKGIVQPIGRLKTAAPNQMQGTGRAQVYSPWGDELYTLYTQQSSAGHESGAFSGNHAFVHLLNLSGSWTHCIDLPHTFGHGDATASAITVSPDGTNLFVVDWTNGQVAVAGPKKVKVTRTASVSFGAPDDRTFAAASDDLLYVGGGSEVVVLDAATLEVAFRWAAPDEVTGLALSEDGVRLYVASGETVTAVDSASGEVTGETEAEGALGLAHAAPAP
jgi:hypothetical protein